MTDQTLLAPADIVAKWLKRSKRIQDRHYDAAATMMRWHRWSGGFLVVLSVIEGSTLLKTVTTDTTLSSYEAIVVGSIALVVAVLAALQAFMSFETRSRLHYMAGVKYGAIKRKLESKIAADADGSGVASYLGELGPEWDVLTEESEPIPSSIWKKSERKKKASSGKNS